VFREPAENKAQLSTEI